MMELGKYTQSVLTAYGVSVVAIVGLIVQSLWRNARARAALNRQEQSTKGGRDAR
ncbi:heme exporter protein CcmD [Paracoccus jeotgali]|uniref:Heme exporter protein D n=1 Tax=Paracoccus jeotgali TaxID=2065379 RepID=A0A2K9MC47_9RHOB|nr:heme exporter protein CcmD [Paracoccus jeotgali]AUM73219.1 heme exporter protein CcmD [Paracoccus jeotgali]